MGQSLGDGDRVGDTKFKSGDWGQGLKIEKWGLGTGTGKLKVGTRDRGWLIFMLARLSPLVPVCPQLEKRVFRHKFWGQKIF